MTVANISHGRRRAVDIGPGRVWISLDTGIWNELASIAAARGIPVSRLVAEIDRAKTCVRLSSAIRIYVLDMQLRRRHQAMCDFVFRRRRARPSPASTAAGRTPAVPVAPGRHESHAVSD